MRIVLILAGVAMGVYGAVLVLDNPTHVIVLVVGWAIAAAVVHDFVFAPLCAVIGMAGRRIIRGRWWTPVSVAGLCTVVLALLAIPVYSRPGALPDNATVVDRDYPTGLWVSLAVVWACVPLYWAITRLLPVGQHEAVEQQGSDHVERQPPSV